MKKSICIISMDFVPKVYKYQLFLIRELSLGMDKVIILTESMDGCIEQNKNVEVVYDVELYDVNRWKKFITENYSKLLYYDEWFLCNDSMFGPVNDLNSLLAKMRRRQSDFWGITSHMPIITTKITTNEFIQRYFMCFRGRKAQEHLHAFMYNLDSCISYQQTEEKYEFVLTQYLKKCGLVSDVYINTSELNGKDNKFFISHILFNIDILLEKKAMPFIPKYIFNITKEVFLNYGDSMQVQRTLDFLKKNTKYAIDNIYEYIVENVNMYTIVTNMNLFFTIREKKRISILPKIYPKVVIVAYLFYEDEMDERIQYLRSIHALVDIIIITDSKYKKDTLKRRIDFECRIIVSRPRGREWAGFLIETKKYIENYKYLCFLHDKKTDYMAYKSIGKSFQSLLWENMVLSKNYVENIIDFFEKNSYIGVLLPPIPNFGVYTGLVGNYWTVCFDETIKLAKRIGIPLSYFNRENPPLSIGSCFWCRTDAITPLLDIEWSYEDFQSEPLPIDGTLNHALERIIPYVAQMRGYLSAYIVNEQYDQSIKSNNFYMLRELINAVNTSGTFENIINEIEKVKL